MMNIFDGIYIAYMTGALGSSLGMYVFKDGKLAGGDVGGGKYRGTYRMNATTSQADCLIEFLGLPGVPTIGGSIFPANAEPVQVPISLPIEIDPNEIFKFETPLGTINVKLEKMQKF